MAISLVMIDDSQVDIMMVKNASKKLKEAVDFSSFISPEEALEFIDKVSRGELHLDDLIILLDINMPKISGFEVLDLIRKDMEMFSTPVIMFSTSSNLEDFQIALEKGANAYLVKPISTRDYNNVIQSAVGFWKYHCH
ncbi:response regulator [Negadavirga shengliensis]|uniref:Response regulator n=1 Tax=Negadavirga shengliensis TaxID=1389218 RepID=A0ABV9T0B4_9BACT